MRLFKRLRNVKELLIRVLSYADVYAPFVLLFRWIEMYGNGLGRQNDQSQRATVQEITID